jgi:triacylglycerol lipase
VAYSPDLAVSLGRHVRQAYALYFKGDPADFVPYAGYGLIAKIYANDLSRKIGGHSVYGYVAQNPAPPHDVVVAFRGTEDMFEWVRDFEFGHRAHPACDTSAPPLECEAGFSAIYATCRDAVLAAIAAAKGGRAPLYVAGHSLGAAIATLLAFDVACRAKNGAPLPVPTVYTFASPRVGTAPFASAYDTLVPESYRIANAPDLVPHTPPAALGYQHVSTLVPVDSGASAKHSVACWHALTTYLHALDPTIPLDASCAPAVSPAGGSPAPGR